MSGIDKIDDVADGFKKFAEMIEKFADMLRSFEQTLRFSGILPAIKRNRPRRHK